MSPPLLALNAVTVRYPARRTGLLHRAPPVAAVDSVSLQLEAGRTLGVIGESGCGKSTLARLVVGLLRPDAGAVAYAGRDITRLDPRQRQHSGVSMQIVFQDPQSSLDPRMNVRELIDEPLVIAGRPTGGVAAALAEQVGLPPDALDKKPHEFSGGQRQRIAIARALAGQPRLLVLDEPTSALDLSVQAQILNLLLDLQQQHGLAYLFISHDIAVIRHMADDVVVMVRGNVVESGPAADVLERPQHPYTRRLVQSALVAGTPDALQAMLEQARSAATPRDAGCVYRNNCPDAAPGCEQAQALRPARAGPQQVRCHLQTAR